MSGITDKTVRKGHGLTPNTEVHKGRLHKQDVEAKGGPEQLNSSEATSTQTQGAETDHKESTLHKVKQAFHRQKMRAKDGV
ncbi:hypothetical protein N7513_003674 [Penicillium frequentans]|nr:hypothetical protein N7513_003674 [Penicillium glabrum]